MSTTAELPSWQQRLMRSGFFLGALLFHLVLFLMVATWVVFAAPVAKTEVDTFLPVSIHPPPPTATPPPSGGEAVNHFEPTTQMAPAPAETSMITTHIASTFQVKSVSVPIPSLPASATPPIGTGMQGHDMPGLSSGAGTPFGSLEGNGVPQLQGFLFDLKQTPDRKPTKMDPGSYHAKITQFIKADWDANLLSGYYKSAQPLNTSSIFIPTINAADGPKAFGVENEVQPNMYVIWYKVTASPAQGGNYRFVGIADDILAVRVNGVTVLDGSLFPVHDVLRKKEKTYPLMLFKATTRLEGGLWVGSPFHVSSGEKVDIDVLIGEQPGGKSNYFLYIQREESKYAAQANGAPLLPIFQLDPKPIHPAGTPGSYPPFAPEPEPWTASGK